MWGGVGKPTRGEGKFSSADLQVGASEAQTRRSVPTVYYQVSKRVCSSFPSPPLGERVRVRGNIIYLLPWVINGAHPWDIKEWVRVRGARE